MGLSPRGRGKRGPPFKHQVLKRSIPAWAGETLPAPGPGGLLKVYPRVGGGNAEKTLYKALQGGLSPRGRGKRGESQGCGGGQGSIPAWAGETRPPPPAASADMFYPRVGGGNRPPSSWIYHRQGLSPRGRGKPPPTPPPVGPPGSIPAWAGETTTTGRRRRYRLVYPRVGGGNASMPCPPVARQGLSPRGRGKPRNGAMEY